MKTIFFTVFSLLIFVSAEGQVREVGTRQYYKQGDIELSFFASMGKALTKTTSSSTNYLFYEDSIVTYQYEDTFENDHLSFFIGGGISYCFIDGLSIEPEIAIYLPDKDPSYSIIGNLCYIFSLSGNHSFPYLKIGYGYAALNDYSETKGSPIFNAAAGLKLRLSSHFMYRLEINYRRFNKDYSVNNGYYPHSVTSIVKTKSEYISLIFGINILL